jgi:hypothetical protein
MLTDPQPTETQFQSIHWDGNMPDAQGPIAKIFNAVPKPDQIKHCEKMTQFLLNQTDLVTLNLDTTLVPFIIAVPGNTRKVRVVFGVGSGFGLNGINENPLQNTVLALHGEHEHNVTIPTVHALPSDTLALLEFNIPTDKDYNTDRLKIANDTPNNKHHWFKHKDLRNECSMPLAIPIPAFIILDAFDKDIDSVIIFERIMSLPEDDKLPDATKTFILNFLKATVVKSTVTENNVKLQDSLFYSQPTPLANKWKSIRLKQLLPTLINPPAADPNTTAAGAAQPLALNAELIATIIRAARGDARNEQVGEEEAKENEDNAATDTNDGTLGLSESAFAKLLTMCGVAQGCPDEVPPLWTTLAEKGATKVDKESEVRKTLAKAIRWKEAKVKPLTTLISMIAKRQFEGDLTVSTLASATKGLTPFAVPCMTQSEVDNINEYEQALAQATATTMSDVKANKIKASAPGTHAGLLKVVRRFGNLVFAIFSEDSPLFIQIDGIVEDLENFEDTAQANMSKQSIASILWILHLQSRHFAAGLMTGDQAILAEFQHMRNSIRMKLPIQHGDVPRELYVQPTSTQNKRPNDRFFNDDGAKDNDPKRPRNGNSSTEFVSRDDIYHPKIKAALDPIYTMLRHKPLIRTMCTKAGINQSQLFPNSDNKLCIKAQIQGRCFANCKLKHEKVSDADAEIALKALKKVIDKPELLKVN